MKGLSAKGLSAKGLSNVSNVLAPMDIDRQQGGSMVQQIIARNKLDMQQNSLDVNHPSPWNFPLDVVEFNTTQGRVLPENFNIYSVTPIQRQELLNSNDFLVHYVMAILTFTAHLQDGHIDNTEAMHIVFISLVQFYSSTLPNSEQRKIICHLIVQLHQTAIRARTRGIENLLNYTQTFVNACALAGAANQSFLHSVVQQQIAYANRANQRF